MIISIQAPPSHENVSLTMCVCVLEKEREIERENERMRMERLLKSKFSERFIL